MRSMELDRWHPNLLDDIPRHAETGIHGSEHTDWIHEFNNSNRGTEIESKPDHSIAQGRIAGGNPEDTA
jgi:hypothetical protein